MTGNVRLSWSMKRALLRLRGGARTRHAIGALAKTIVALHERGLIEGAGMASAPDTIDHRIPGQIWLYRITPAGMEALRLLEDEGDVTMDIIKKGEEP